MSRIKVTHREGRYSHSGSYTSHYHFKNWYSPRDILSFNLLIMQFPETILLKTRFQTKVNVILSAPLFDHLVFHKEESPASVTTMYFL